MFSMWSLPEGKKGLTLKQNTHTLSEHWLQLTWSPASVLIRRIRAFRRTAYWGAFFMLGDRVHLPDSLYSNTMSFPKTIGGSAEAMFIHPVKTDMNHSH